MPGPRFVTVASLAQLAEGAFLRVRVEGHALVLARTARTIYAFQATCPHEMTDLAQGRIEGGRLICPRHLASFALTDGAVSTGWENVAPLKLYPVRVDNNGIAVDADAVVRNPPGGGRKVWDFTKS